MKRLFTLIGLLFFSAGLHILQAQEEMPDTIGIRFSQPIPNRMYMQSPSLWYAPLWSGYGPLGTWDLHDGFNANIEMGVRVGWGKNNPWKGGSFFSNLSGMYVMPLSKDGRWSAAMGGYYSNFRMWGDRKNTIGLMGMVDYRINDRLNAGFFATHDFGLMGDKSFPFSPMPWLDNPSTTIGANMGIKMSESVRLNVSVSYTHQHENDRMFPQSPPPPPPASFGNRPNRGRDGR